MQIANQKHHPILNDFAKEVEGLRPICFNQTQFQINENHKAETTDHKIVETVRQVDQSERDDTTDEDHKNRVAMVKAMKGNWVDPNGVGLSQDAENFPRYEKKHSLNMSEDLHSTNKANLLIKKKEFGSSFREKLDIKRNMSREENLNKFPHFEEGSRQECHILKYSENIENEAVELTPNSTKNVTNHHKFIKTLKNTVSETSRETRDFQQCEIFSKNANITLSKFPESPSRNKLCSEKSKDSLSSTNASYNSGMFGSSIMEPATVPLFFLNKFSNCAKKEAKIDKECQTENYETKKSKELLYQTINELETEVLKERNMRKTHQSQIEELEKLILLNEIKYEANLKELEKEWVKKSEVILCEVREKHEKEIEEVISEINEISSKQLRDSISRFQASIKAVQEEYKNFRISNESEKSELLGKIGEFEEIVKRMTDEIVTLKESSVINKIDGLQIDEWSQTSDSQRLEKTRLSDIVKFEEMEVKQKEQEKIIESKEKKEEEYKTEDDRILHRAEDYLRYLRENEIVIYDLETQIEVLEKDLHQKNKNYEKLVDIIDCSCSDFMKVQMERLNRKYEDLERLDEGL